MLTTLLVTLLLVVAFFGLRYWYLHFFSWYRGLPIPEHHFIVEKDLQLAMPDGVKLATDIYRPNTKKKCPVIITRTIYNKSGKEYDYQTIAKLFASHGYVFIVQDVRGKHSSEGEFVPYLNEGVDGNTTVTWAGIASWSNGNVALVGISYSGSCAWLAAQYKNPYLKTILPMFSTENAYHMWVYRGIPFFQGPLYWLSKYIEKKDNDDVTPVKFSSMLSKLPVNELDIHLSNHKISYYRDYLAHIKPDHFWKTLSSQFANIEELDIPAFIVSGWYDPFLRGTVDDYQRLQNSPPSSKNLQSMIHIGPWTHNPTHTFKDINFGANADFYHIFAASLAWCDRWLKDKTPVDSDFYPVHYFLMGHNRWVKAKSWPPEKGIHKIFFLKSEVGMKTLCEALSQTSATTGYTYDPNSPVSFREKGTLSGGGPFDQKEIESREDVLVFASAPFEEELTVVGVPKVILYVSSSSIDTDFYVKICDIHPDGRAFNLTTGFLRMRYRDSLDEPAEIVPGKIYRIEITLQDIANTFLKGHAIQLQITSSDFPMLVRNLNTGFSSEFSDEVIITEQKVYSGGIYDSHLELPQPSG